MADAADSSFTTEVGPNDVVLGRGTPIARMEGNVRFRALCATCRGDYLGTGRNRIKHVVAKEVHAELQRRNARFLRKATPEEVKELGVPNGVVAAAAAVWVILSDNDALEKIKQTLREDRCGHGRAKRVDDDDEEEMLVPPVNNQEVPQVASSTSVPIASNSSSSNGEQRSGLLSARNVPIAPAPTANSAPTPHRVSVRFQIRHRRQLPTRCFLICSMLARTIRWQVSPLHRSYRRQSFRSIRSLR
jgi:hypothetical protein